MESGFEGFLALPPSEVPESDCRDEPGFFGRGNMENRTAPVMSLGDWIITFIILAIPLVNIIMLFVWGFSSSTNPNKANFAKATLIVYLVCAVLFFLFGGMAFLGAMRGMPQGT